MKTNIRGPVTRSFWGGKGCYGLCRQIVGLVIAECSLSKETTNNNLPDPKNDPQLASGFFRISQYCLSYECNTDLVTPHYAVPGTQVSRGLSTEVDESHCRNDDRFFKLSASPRVSALISYTFLVADNGGVVSGKNLGSSGKSREKKSAG